MTKHRVKRLLQPKAIHVLFCSSSSIIEVEFPHLLTRPAAAPSPNLVDFGGGARLGLMAKHVFSSVCGLRPKDAAVTFVVSACMYVNYFVCVYVCMYVVSVVIV